MQFSIILLIAPLLAAAVPSSRNYLPTVDLVARDDGRDNDDNSTSLIKTNATETTGSVVVTEFLGRIEDSGSTNKLLGVEYIQFLVNGNNTCIAVHPGPGGPGYSFPCGPSGIYSFRLVPNESATMAFGVIVYKQILGFIVIQLVDLPWCRCSATLALPPSRSAGR